MSIVIRPVQTVDEYHACEALQRRVWAMPDDREVVPLHLLMAVHRNGGLLLGAFDDDRLLGIVFGFPGFTADGKLKHCSHMTGVDPQCQGTGIGFQLKLAQRDSALAQGLDLVTWTFDPLEGRNAHLNFRKLGVVCRAYVRDYYGPLTDGLNAGLPTDRFQVEWWIASERVQQRLAGGTASPRSGPIARANITSHTPQGLLEPGVLELDASAPTVKVEVPADYQTIKSADPSLALAWRQASRQMFESYFAAGYAAIDFVSHQVEGMRRSFYVLQAGWSVLEARSRVLAVA